MSSSILAVRLRGLFPGSGARPAWFPVWSSAAALRAVRATLVVPGLFALTDKVMGNLQLATFAAFGGFATLVMASFGGSRRDRLVAHLGLAVVGSVLLVIGTAVNSSIVLAVCVTVPVVFAVLFAGVAGPNVASGGTAALLAYVLPAASPGTIAMIPSRLAGWWIASVVGTAAVLALSPRPPADRLRAAAAASARALAEQLDAAVRGEATPAHRAASIEAKHRLMTAFSSTPFRPTGLATADQALESVIAMLEWCTAVVTDSLHEYGDLHQAPPPERQLMAQAGVVLREAATLLEGGDGHPDFDRLERSLAECVAHLRQLGSDGQGFGDAVHLSFHARTVAGAAYMAALNSMVAARRAGPELVAFRRRRWYGLDEETGEPPVRGRLAAAGDTLVGHASLRSVWFLNSVRGAIALAAAIAVADLSGVQHAFWVVLGTLSVLRSNAAGTGSTAWRALLGTALGVVVGAALLIAIGTGSGALWAALPAAVLVAAYAPGTLPFTAGQAAFTVVVSVLFNLLVPAGWQIGVIRIEDVAIGCAVSLVVGVLFWPRGAGPVVADDLADTYRRGAAYLAAAVDWALGQGGQSPTAAPAVIAAGRLDDGLRGFLTEQGAKRVSREDLWRLLGGTMRLRLTAHSLAEGIPRPESAQAAAEAGLREYAGRLASWYDHLASHLGQPGHHPIEPLADPTHPTTDPGTASDGAFGALWVEQHLRHLTSHLPELVEPAERVAAIRRAPWWR